MSDSKISEEIKVAIGQALAPLQGKTLTDWAAKVDNCTNNNPATTPAFFSPAFTYHYEGAQLGGSFAQLAPDQRDAFLEALFPVGADWIKDYMNNGTLPSDPKQRAVAEALHTLSVAMYDFSPGESVFGANNFSGSVRDGQLLDGELAALLKEGEIITRYGDRMGEYGPRFALLAGTLLSSQLDLDDGVRDRTGLPVRYTENEFQVFVPQPARNAIPRFVGSPVQQMNNICGPFTAPASRPTQSCNAYTAR